MELVASDKLLNSSEITQLLRRWQDGDAQAREHLVEAVYHQVRAIALKAIRASGGATLSPTELAHEALLRLLGVEASWEDRQHFFNVVAQATRQVLVDAARRRTRLKHGAGETPISLTAANDVAAQDDEALLRLNDALDQLALGYTRCASVLELTYFAGLDRNAIAQLMQCSLPTVDRDLRFGKAWLKRVLEN